MDEKWVNYYENLAKAYHDPVSQSGYLLENEPIDEAIFDRWVAFIQHRFLVSSKHYLLDVGCGAGLFLRRFSKFTKHLYGVDPSEGQIKLARVNCPSATVRLGNSLDASFPGVGFDRVICNSVFLLFPSLSYAREVVAHLLSISGPQAWIWIGDLPLPTLEMKEGNYRRLGRSTGLEAQHYPPSFMANICEDLGVHCQYVRQEVEGKETAKYRYDWLIWKTPDKEQIGKEWECE